MEFETWDEETLIKKIKAVFAIVTQLPEGEKSGIEYPSSELLKKNKAELQILYFNLKTKIDKNFILEYEAELNRLYKFNGPGYDADFIYWSKLPYWEIDEAIALLLGKDPDKMTWEQLKGDADDVLLAKNFNKIRKAAFRYMPKETVMPKDFLIWANEMGFDVPAELNKYVNSFESPTTNWQILYEQLQEEHEEVLKKLSEKDEIISKFNENQKQFEQKKLLGMVLGMAIDMYGYKPSARNKATGSNKNSIRAKLELIGIEITDDTIRSYLNKAERLFPEIKVKDS